MISNHTDVAAGVAVEYGSATQQGQDTPGVMWDAPIPAPIPVLTREEPAAGWYLWEGFSAGPRSSAAGRAGGCGMDTPRFPFVGPRETVWGEQEEGRTGGAAEHRNISCRRALTS